MHGCLETTTNHEKKFYYTLNAQHNKLDSVTLGEIYLIVLHPMKVWVIIQSN